MKPNEITTRSFKLYPSNDQASKYFCAGKVVAQDGYVAFCSEDKKLNDIHFVSFSGAFWIKPY